MKEPLRIRTDAEPKISFSGGFLVCVRIPIYCRRVGGLREVLCDFSRLADPREREMNLVLFSRN